MAQETTLRQFKRAKLALMDLANDAGYDSSKLSYLLSLVPHKDDVIDPINFGDEEVKILIIRLNSGKFRIFELSGLKINLKRSNCRAQKII